MINYTTGNITASLQRGPDGLTTFTLDPLGSPYPCYHLFSPHGDTTMITDSQGGSIATTRYDSFGNTTAGVTGLWYGYTGKYERYSDGATGAIEMGVREYDPVLGRFISVDPLKGDPSDPQQRNRYPYVGNDPLVRYDLDGKAWYDPRTWGDDEPGHKMNDVRSHSTQEVSTNRQVFDSNTAMGITAVVASGDLFDEFICIIDEAMWKSFAYGAPRLAVANGIALAGYEIAKPYIYPGHTSTDEQELNDTAQWLGAQGR